MPAQQITGFVELRVLDAFTFDGMDLLCARCDKAVADFYDEGDGISLRFVATVATDHLAECAAQ